MANGENVIALAQLGSKLHRFFVRAPVTAFFVPAEHAKRAG
jgi:hypothetical protein